MTHAVGRVIDVEGLAGGHTITLLADLVLVVSIKLETRRCYSGIPPLGAVPAPVRSQPRTRLSRNFNAAAAAKPSTAVSAIDLGYGLALAKGSGRHITRRLAIPQVVGRIPIRINHHQLLHSATSQ